MARHLTQTLASRNLAHGDRVCITSPNSRDYLTVIDMCLRSGIAPVVVSSSATEREIAEMSGDVGARAVLDEHEIHALVSSASMSVSEALHARELPACRPVHFTSGTSGRPKAVWSGWLDEDRARSWIMDEQNAWGITSSDVHLVCGPLSHSAPLRFALMTLWAGGSVIVPAKFDAATVAGLLPSVTTTFMAPTHLQRLMEHAGNSALEHNLRLLAHAGAACPDRVRLWAYEVFGTDVVTEFYGSTEGQFTTCSAQEWLARPGTVGRARPGRAMRVGSDGKLWSHAPEFARFEYWGDAEKTTSAWDSGWFTVGDYGHIDEDGYVYLEGRKGDLIITGGVNVYPAEIESVLANLPGIAHVVAFALPDDHWGQRVCVAIVGSASEERVHAYALDQLDGPKRPKAVFIVDSLPMTHSGKVDRSAVPALFA